MDIHPSDRKPRDGNVSDPSIHESDDSIEESPSGTDSDDEEIEDVEQVPASQEDFTDDEGLIPDDLEPGQSPIDDMEGFNWNDIDDDFLNSDSEESDSGSTASESSNNGDDKKRKYTETDDEDSDEGSKLSKRQKTSTSRGSSLKGSTKIPNSKLNESTLPTPGVTGDEDGEDGATARSEEIIEAENYDDFDADLEADFMAEFAKEEAEAEAGGAG